MASYGPKATSAPAGAIIIHAGDNVSAIVNGAPAGATFFFEAGVYRGLSLTPKDGQTFIGAEGAVINGSAVLTNFTQEGSRWVIGGQTQEGLRNATGEGDGVSMRAGYPETVFIDDKPLTPVDSLSKVTSGTFYFDYAADKIYIGDNPTGKTVEAGKLDRAFEGNADGVTVQNFIIEKYNTPTQYATVQGNESWTIQDNEVRLNYGVGVDAMDNSKIVGNYVHDNGQMGIGGGGDNLLVEGNEIAQNGWWSGIDVFWEGGGTKFTQTDGLIIRDNYSHDNKGFGLWTDIDNIRTLYENNTVVNNSGGGINHEISYDATIRNNVLVGNGYEPQGGWIWGGQIQIQNSKNVDIYGNRIDMTGADGGNGIGLVQQDRGSGAYGSHTTTGNSIHDNIIVSQDGNGRVGGAADFNESGLLNGGNIWSNNHYYLPAGGDNFWWGDTNSFAEFKAATGETGTISQAYPDTNAWLTASSTDAGTVSDSTGADTGTVGADSGTSPDSTDSGTSPDGGSPDTPPGASDGGTVPGDTSVDTGGTTAGAGTDASSGDAGGGTLPGDTGASTPPADTATDTSPDSTPQYTEVFGDGSANELWGTEASDMIVGRGGNDRLDGGLGDDQLYGNRGRDVLLGADGDDVIDGGRHQDVISGGAGSDSIDGGAGKDVLLLDGTIDDYVIEVANRSVLITNAGGETDVVKGVEQFHFLGSGATFDDGVTYILNRQGLVETNRTDGLERLLNTVGIFDALDPQAAPQPDGTARSNAGLAEIVELDLASGASATQAAQTLSPLAFAFEGDAGSNFHSLSNSIAAAMHDDDRMFG